MDRVVIHKLLHLLNVKGSKKQTGHVIFLVGPPGVGKTTTAAKLAYLNRKKKVGIICADTFRPGTYDQLDQLLKKTGIQIYVSKKEANTIVKEGIEYFQDYDMIIVDTSSQSIITEKADQIIYVVDATMGRAASNQIDIYKKYNIDSCIITKMDGNAKGGGALSAAIENNLDIAYTGAGEKIQNLEIFDPTKFLARILNKKHQQLVDLITTIPNKDQKVLNQRIKQGEFTLNDMYQQLKFTTQMSFLGSLLGEDSKNIKTYICIMDSMTKTELDSPELLSRKSKEKDSRIKRIARGSGKSILKVQDLLDKYTKLERCVKGMSKKLK